MFLKRIDMVGFKSFADKTSIDLSPGITAVVGPNGSGKSNLADAIRWVLGEQSARVLRGTKMEDVIFAGSDSRRGLNFCEVTLTLDNSDRHLPVVFDEVSVTRRTFRSGESEYFINRQPCRLKDIAELFMDSGVGRESYSIIGQGRIEEMLSTRPEDRRGPFEEAAGIVKFKHRKREAERKLEETAANLLRVDDVLAELQRQAEPLQREAEKARRYQALAEALQGFEVALLVGEIERLRVRWEDASAAVTAGSTQRQQAAALLAEREQALAAAKQQAELQLAAATALQQRQLATVAAQERSEGALALARERRAHALAAQAEQLRQGELAVAERDRLLQEQEKVQQRLAQLQAQREAQAAALQAAAGAVDPAERERLAAVQARLHEALIAAHQEAASARNEWRLASASQEQEDRRRERLTAEQARLQEEQMAAESDAAAAQATLDQSRAEELRCAQALAQVAQELAELNRAEAECAAARQQWQAQLASLRSRLDLLQELEEGYDGYAQGVRSVLQAAGKGRLLGVHGAVAHLLHVEKAYEEAIETALGAALQNLVVDSEAAARTAIEWLKRRQAGRATFLPLQVIQPRRLASEAWAKARQHPGCVGLASELVQCRPEHRVVAEHLLGHVVVADQLVHANELARLLEYRVRVVTLAGDVVSPGGAMTGGSHARKGPGLLGRSRERNEAAAALELCQEQVQTATVRQQELRAAIQERQQQQQALLAAQAQARARAAQAAADVRAAEQRRQTAADRLAELSWEAEQVAAGASAWQQRQAQAAAAAAAAAERIQTLEAELASCREQLQAWEQAAADAQASLTELRVALATCEQEERALRGQLQELAERAERLAEQAAACAAAAAAAADQAAAAAAAEAAEAAALERLRAEAQALAEELADTQQQRQQVEWLLAEREQAVRTQQAALAELDEQLHRAEVLAERADLELNHALRRLGETYQMTYEWAREHHPAPTDPASLQRRVEALRREQAALGEVQLGALAEWERLRQRIDFLVQERADLEQARTQLLAVISDIDREMARRFGEVYEQIRAAFQASFRQLFDGGRADLVLTEPDDLLQTGIEVMAQPPGKKLQNLNLLSGGERALTAMALLFAILKVRPVPFCVLDEVEAALDEANVHRFAQQLRKFADETQFIVITHRRGTMEEADVLYGVTMQEAGVSSLIGVRLGEDPAEFESA
ncbi:MAG: chromosome segregation protein SMC [Alicyclobacillus sp.]|nr:chromosome segregation protein SMC [Alicyclobacillus sp.]